MKMKINPLIIIYPKLEQENQHLIPNKVSAPHMAEYYKKSRTKQTLDILTIYFTRTIEYRKKMLWKLYLK